MDANMLKERSCPKQGPTRTLRLGNWGKRKEMCQGGEGGLEESETKAGNSIGPALQFERHWLSYGLTNHEKVEILRDGHGSGI